jgi:2-aminoethylphosphonate-pyruvate transaminase
MSNSDLSIKNFVQNANDAKRLFTAGPASLLPENLTGLRPCFGRGDADYASVDASVRQGLTKMSGHDNVAWLQGSASLALEIMCLNFLYGRVLVLSTGYYADRMHKLASLAKSHVGTITDIVQVAWEDMDDVNDNFDWVIACPTETSIGLHIPIEQLKRFSDKNNAKLMLDATASIGLEGGHELADVIAYSSCKGLFGLTGAAFIAFNDKHTQEVESFYLNLDTHINKGVTGPYHAIASLLDVLPRHDEFREAVIINKEQFCKKFEQWVSFKPENRALLCSHVTCTISATEENAVLYTPRSNMGGSVVCHIGEVHLGKQAKGQIIDALIAN